MRSIPRPLQGLRSRLGTTLALSACLVSAAAALSVSSAAAVAAPTAKTGGASSVTFSSAVLHGAINPNGQATNYFFEYGLTRKYGTESPLAAAGGGGASVGVTQAIAGLQAVKTYHYRIVAVGPGGAVDGDDRTFTTPKIPLSIAIVGVPSPIVFGSPFTVEGTLSGTDGPNHAIQLQANPFPYLGGFQNVGNPAITGPTGAFSLPFLGLLDNAQIRVVTIGTPTVVSPVFVEGVAVRVSFHVHASARRGFARLYGSVTPAQVGSLVGFQLLKAGHRSVNVGGTVVKSGSRFSRVVRVRRGLYKALVQVTDGAHVSGYSAPVLIR
jgi:hypothetical protein